MTFFLQSWRVPCPVLSDHATTIIQHTPLAHILGTFTFIFHSCALCQQKIYQGAPRGQLD